MDGGNEIRCITVPSFPSTAEPDGRFPRAGKELRQAPGAQQSFSGESPGTPGFGIARAAPVA